MSSTLFILNYIEYSASMLFHILKFSFFGLTLFCKVNTDKVLRFSGIVDDWFSSPDVICVR